MAWLTAGPPERIETTVAPSPQTVAEVLWRLRPEVIVVEWFYTGKRLNQYARQTIEICGGLEMIAYILRARVVRHTPKTRERFLDEAERILIERWGPRGSTTKGMGVWTDHQQDAAAHLLAYLHREKATAP